MHSRTFQFVDWQSLKLLTTTATASRFSDVAGKSFASRSSLTAPRSLSSVSQLPTRRAKKKELQTTASSEKLVCFPASRYGNWSLAFPTRILSTRHSRLPVPSEAASTDRNAARGTRQSPARLRSSKWHTTKARNCGRSAGKKGRLLLTSISSPIFGARFTTSATTQALEIVWTQTATTHHNIWPENFWREDQPGSFIRAFGTKSEHASFASDRRS